MATPPRQMSLPLVQRVAPAGQENSKSHRVTEIAEYELHATVGKK